jgi:sugar lactone lactonase YvrE
MKLLQIALSLLLLTSLTFAEGTRTWEQTKYDDFEKGSAKGVAIRSDGSLELAPTFKSVFTSPSTYIWSIVSDNQGNIFAASGSPARVYRITPNGTATIIFAPKELQVQALALADDGTLFAATSPDGRVYKIVRKGTPAEKTAAKQAAQPPVNTAQNAAANEPGGNRAQASLPIDPDYTATVFFEPKTKYIWDLALDSEGRLYIATGDNGEIFRVDRSGQGDVFFKSDEAHIRTLAIDNKQNLIAGSDGSGLVYRISPKGDGFVLYSAPKKEITALAVDQQGNIYAAGVGEKRGGQSTGSSNNTNSSTTQSQLPGTVTPLQQPSGLAPGVVIPLQTLAATGGSEVYRLAPDGSPRRVWSSPTDIVYTLAFDGSGRLIAGTGNRGRIYSIAPDGTFADLLEASASQVTALARSADGGLHVSTSNLGKIFDLGATAGSEGTFESDVFDAHIFSKWGRTRVRGTGIIDLYARSGNVDNPDRNWSAWRKVDLHREMPIDTPPAQFIQWRAVLHEGNPGPSLDSVTLYYLPKNVAPEIDEIYVQVGARFPTVTHQDSNTITVGPPQQQVHYDNTPTAVRDRNSIAVRWDAHDDNDDDLVYSLWYRGDGESRWKLLQDNLSDKYFSFDAGLVPDGGYTMRIVASDAPSHTPQDALSAQKESSRFEVDNTPPVVQNLASVYDGSNIHTTFRAEDSFSVIKHAEFSVDAGDWQTVEPVGQISDSRVENYDFTVPINVAAPAVLPNPVEGVPESAVRTPNNNRKRNPKNTPAPPAPTEEEHIVVVRVVDRFDNMGSAKVIVRSVPVAPAKK